MNRTRLAWAVAALLASVAVAAAPEPTVNKIVADYVAARGGVAKIRSVQTLRQTGRASTGGGREAAVTRELKRPGKSRFELTVQGMTAVYVVNAGTGWRVSPFEEGLQAQPLEDDAVAEAMEQVDFEGPLVDWKAKGHRVELAGREPALGRDAYKLKVTLGSGDVRYDYIDVKTHRHVRTDATRTVRGRAVRLEMTFADHAKTGGILFPRTVEVAAEGRPQRLRIVVDTIEVNPPISDVRFERSSRAP
jgi:hypothetical protein